MVVSVKHSKLLHQSFFWIPSQALPQGDMSNALTWMKSGGGGVRVRVRDYKTEVIWSLSCDGGTFQLDDHRGFPIPVFICDGFHRWPPSAVHGSAVWEELDDNWRSCGLLSSTPFSSCKEDVSLPIDVQWQHFVWLSILWTEGVFTLKGYHQEDACVCPQRTAKTLFSH